MKKFAITFCLFIFVIQLIQIAYFQRSNFTEKYDVQYWKDRYEHSQYQLPLSKRIIGDDGLFAYSGYRLINGDNPFSINNDKPPVAKYLFGLSILLFQNPLYAVLFFGFCTLVVFYFIAKHFFKDAFVALFATTLIFLDPLFFSQFWITGLDLMQLFFLLLNLLLLMNISKLRRWNLILILGSGLSLGFFMEVKPPILLPIIFILETGYLLYKGLKKEYLLFMLGLFLGIMIPYIRFMYLGNGIIDVLKVHKYMAAIYLQSQLKVHIGAIWLTLFTGKFPDLVTGSLLNVFEWWILWPILTLLGIIMALLSFFVKKNPIFHKGLAVFLLVSLIVFTFIPAYTRYLVLVLPFLYLFGVSFFQKFLSSSRPFLYLILLMIGIINSFFFLLPKPDKSVSGFYYNLSHLYFHDIYQENITDSNSLGLTRGQFRQIVNKAFDDAQIETVDIKELSRNIPMFSVKGAVRIGLTYKTQNLGSFYEEKLIKLVQRDGKWKIKWDWDIVFNGFSPDFTMQTEIALGKRGSIISPNGKILAQDYESYLVSVNPEKIDLKRENEMLNLINFIGNVKSPHAQNAYLENSLPGTYTPLISPQYLLDEKAKVKLLSFPGVKLVPYSSRIYNGIDRLTIANEHYQECCTRIYSSYNYHGTKGLEKEFDKVLWGYSGGKILMKDNEGAIIKVVFEKNKKDGKDIVLSQ